MKLSDLARKASRLPELKFDCAGTEQWHERTFDVEIINLYDLIKYTKDLRLRIAEQSKMLSNLAEAYNQLSEIILEADVETNE